MQLTRVWSRAYILFYSKVSFDIDGLFLTFLWDDIIIMRMMMSVMSIMADKAMINPSYIVKYQTKKDKNNPQSNDSDKNLNEHLLFSQPLHS